jgi:tryptophan-rich sensory protein
MRRLAELLVAILVCELAGLIGSLFTFASIPTWYASLVKPALNPPSWVFGPVWTTLYAMMGVSVFLVWQRRQAKGADQALTAFALQLVLNALWSVLFFGLRNAGLALIEIVMMWLAIAWTIVLFHRLSKPAAYLLLPYLAWVSFASYLNAAIWFLNR